MDIERQLQILKTYPKDYDKFMEAYIEQTYINPELYQSPFEIKSTVLGSMSYLCIITQISWSGTKESREYWQHLANKIIGDYFNSILYTERHFKDVMTQEVEEIYPEYII